MGPMHVDHLTFAVGSAGLKAESERLGALLGERFRDGGFHPRFGTRNHILPLADDRYIETRRHSGRPSGLARKWAAAGWVG